MDDDCIQWGLYDCGCFPGASSPSFPLFVSLRSVRGLPSKIMFSQVPETYAPALLRKRARRLASSLGATHITSYDAGRALGGWKAEAKQYLVRPFLFL